MVVRIVNIVTSVMADFKFPFDAITKSWTRLRQEEPYIIMEYVWSQSWSKIVNRKSKNFIPAACGSDAFGGDKVYLNAYNLNAQQLIDGTHWKKSPKTHTACQNRKRIVIAFLFDLALSIITTTTTTTHIQSILASNHISFSIDTELTWWLH